MHTGITTRSIREAPPRFQARMAGAFAWIGTTEGFAIWVRSRLVVDSDAAATAHNILAHELLYRWGFVGDVISCVAFIIYTLLLYNLFRPVSRRLSLLAAVSNLVGEAIQLSIGVFLLAPLVVLGGAHSLSTVNAAQSQTLALMFLNFYGDGYAISMVLFGFWNILTGYLIFRSTFLPRILGVLLAISGLCYQIDNFAGFLWPAFQAHLEPYILLPGVAELLLALWLVVMGVNNNDGRSRLAQRGNRDPEPRILNSIAGKSDKEYEHSYEHFGSGASLCCVSAICSIRNGASITRPHRRPDHSH